MVNTWTNNDGLVVQFGTDKALRNLSGSPAQAGEYKVLEALIDYSRLPTVAAGRTGLEVANRTFIPAGALLVSATLKTITAFDSTNDDGTLTIGLQKENGDVYDEDGIDVAIAQSAIDAVGETVTCDGALVGTILAYNSYLTTTVGTHAFTAGKAHLVIKYFVPATA